MNVLVGFILLIAGILQIVIPAQMFMLGKKWQFREGTEPSEASVFFTRVCGVVVVIVYIFFMFS